MAILLFQPKFHRAVEAGEKCQTIRPLRKRPILRGDQLSLRAWTGKPYRSKQRELRTAICQHIKHIIIDENFADDEEARRDGFCNAEEMRIWFQRVHGLPFSGVKITWQ